MARGAMERFPALQGWINPVRLRDRNKVRHERLIVDLVTEALRIDDKVVRRGILRKKATDGFANNR